MDKNDIEYTIYDDTNSASIKMLVVEDESVSLMLLVSLLEKLGYAPDKAVDGQEAFELLKETDYDIVITDFNMPRMNGLELIVNIRELDENIKTILITAYNEPKILKDAINIGVDKFLEKPVKLDNLDKVLSDTAKTVHDARNLKKYQLLLNSYRTGVDSSNIFALLDKDGNFIHINKLFSAISDYHESELIGKHYSYIRKHTSVSQLFSADMADSPSDVCWAGFCKNIGKYKNEYVTEIQLIPIYGNSGVEGYISIEKDMTPLISQHTRIMNDIFNSENSMIIAINSDKSETIFNVPFLDFLNETDNVEVARSLVSGYSLDLNNPLKVVVEPDVYEINSLSQLIDLASSMNEQKISFVFKNRAATFYILDVYTIKQGFIGQEDMTVIRFNNITELEIIKDNEINRSMLASIGKLSAGITHEINTPLTYIKGNCELIQMAVDNSSDQELSRLSGFFDSIEDGFNRITSIIDSMREITGEMVCEFENYNLYSTFVHAARITYNRSKHISPVYINGEQVSLDMKPSTEEYFTSVCPRMIEQVWIILLNNSLDQLAQMDLDYKKKYVNITIIESDNYYVIRFEDNGGGVDTKIQNNLFQLFVSSKKHNGMGLGLNIAKSIIDKHGGDISQYNTDAGAVFEIKLEKMEGA
jgi:PAS domain S-box-containing protein